jgi:hypothetical protein
MLWPTCACWSCVQVRGAQVLSFDLRADLSRYFAARGADLRCEDGEEVKVPMLLRMHSKGMEVSASVVVGTPLTARRSSNPSDLENLLDVRCRVFLWRYLYRRRQFPLNGESFDKGKHLAEASQNSIFMPELLVSLFIRPEGNETPNFALALNRF